MKYKIDIKSIFKDVLFGSTSDNEIDIIQTTFHKTEVVEKSASLIESPNLFKPFYDRLEYSLFYLAKDRPLEQIIKSLDKKGNGKFAQEYIERAIAQGLIKQVEGVEKLNLLKIDELKFILKSNDLKVTGKKSELINRIYMNINDNLYSPYLPKGIILIRTSRGEEHYHELLKARETEKDIVFTDVLNYVFENNYKLACMLLEDRRLFDYKFNLNGFESYFQPDPMNVRIPYVESYTRLKEKYGNVIGSYIISFLIYGEVIESLLTRYLNHNNQGNENSYDNLLYTIKSECDNIKSANRDLSNSHFDHVKDFETVKNDLQKKIRQTDLSRRSLKILIIDTRHNYIGELDASERFDTVLFKKLFVNKFKELLPTLKIELDIVDDEHCLLYPKLVGVQSPEDEALILEAVEAVADFLLFEGEYILTKS
jgi:hypothetical protein